MAIKFKNKKATAAVELGQEEGLSQYASRIDKTGQLMAEADILEASLTKAVQAKLAKIVALRKKAKAQLAELATEITLTHIELGTADEAKAEEVGTAFVAELGKRSTSRSITDMPLVKTLMDDQDPELFMKLVKMNIGDLDAYLTVDERDLVMSTTLGDRSIKLVPRVI